MRIYVDTNVILDFLMKRQPFFDDAYKLFSELAKEDELIGYVSVKALTDIYYLYRKFNHNDIDTIRNVVKLIDILYIADNTKVDLLKALCFFDNDFEDDLIVQLATRMKLDYIVTRNGKDFGKSRVMAITPKECLEILPNFGKAAEFE